MKVSDYSPHLLHVSHAFACTCSVLPRCSIIENKNLAVVSTFSQCGFVFEMSTNGLYLHSIIVFVFFHFVGYDCICLGFVLVNNCSESAVVFWFNFKSPQETTTTTTNTVEMVCEPGRWKRWCCRMHTLSHAVCAWSSSFGAMQVNSHHRYRREKKRNWREWWQIEWEIGKVSRKKKAEIDECRRR